MDSQGGKGGAAGRSSITMNAKLRIIGGKGLDVTVTDLTVDGCSIAIQGVELRLKQPVSIKLESLDFIKGRISGSSETGASIEFERPLYGPVFEHLLRTCR